MSERRSPETPIEERVEVLSRLYDKREIPNYIEAALSYARMGLAVFPLRHPDPSQPAGCSCRHADCSRPAKHPRYAMGRKYAAASTDPVQIVKWWSMNPLANIGIRTGDDFDVLDIDTAEGVEALRELDIANVLAGCPVSKSGRASGDGYHYWFRAGNTSNFQGAKGKAKGWDWRGTGGYIVAPPSLHPSGNRYLWVPGRELGKDVKEAPEIPQPLKEMLSQSVDYDIDLPVRPPVVRSTPATQRDRLWAEARLKGRCDDILNAPDHDGNKTFFLSAIAVFQVVASGLLDERTAVEALRDAVRHRGTRTGRPMGTSEFEATLRSGERAGRAQPLEPPWRRGSTTTYSNGRPQQEPAALA